MTVDYKTNNKNLIKQTILRHDLIIKSLIN